MNPTDILFIWWYLIVSYIIVLWYLIFRKVQLIDNVDKILTGAVLLLAPFVFIFLILGFVCWCFGSIVKRCQG